ncbi:hypothetical protein [Roseococcus sp. YIM B11640]|uniref:hypothetical protein n=1 Tax=Roseococcus sp. YIM B11640 TaxID=3133973 RepID=UPI003C79BE44
MLLAALPGAAGAQLVNREALGVRLDDLGDRVDALQGALRSRGAGVLGLMGYNMTPDGSANAVQVNRTRTDSVGKGDRTLTLSQLGSGFTLSESFPLYLEGYIGTARYDPRAAFTGLGARDVPLKWNNIAATVGVGYDIRIGEYLYLRPILNVAAGYAASDLSLFGAFVRYRTDTDLDFLTKRHVNVWGIGGSMVLAYYDHRPRREIDLELRYTQLHLRTFGDTLPSARGSAVAQTAALWARYRWPTGFEAFGRPVRWVIDSSASYYLGDQRDVMGFSWAVKVGGGIEFDVGRQEIGAAGLNLSRVRIIARYFFADNNITGTSIGLGFSF